MPELGSLAGVQSENSLGQLDLKVFLMEAIKLV
jgi:hypothetical protein